MDVALSEGSDLDGLHGVLQTGEVHNEQDPGRPQRLWNGDAPRHRRNADVDVVARAGGDHEVRALLAERAHAMEAGGVGVLPRHVPVEAGDGVEEPARLVVKHVRADAHLAEAGDPHVPARRVHPGVVAPDIESLRRVALEEVRAKGLGLQHLQVAVVAVPEHLHGNLLHGRLAVSEGRLAREYQQYVKLARVLRVGVAHRHAVHSPNAVLVAHLLPVLV
eukprot:CAMPEP_0171201906 /NCGR_PEP_ID=MMETSP0790-20130122/24730_1 /TAXON_ID=2925 /ORGANISM="Alexandrium catenella, Strain OF101" /LENGTH=219 /DNA_ID=CAMNT_0011667317 /DNA_START=66 /DNA_END=722 /DNA_ORIENTATION=-